MEIFVIVLLIIIAFLLAIDVFYLRKISNSPTLGMRRSLDKRYFELKFELRVLEAVAAILLFVGTFLGASSLNEIKEGYKSDLDKEIKILEDKTAGLDQKVSGYSKALDALKSEEEQSIENLSDVKREFGDINRKIAKTQERFKLNPRIYVVRNLRFEKNTDKGYMTIYYNKLKTIYGERLPTFSKPPISNVQGYASQIDIVEKTKEYIKVNVSAYYFESEEQYFDVWIVDPD